MDIKTQLYVQKRFVNDLVMIRKTQVTLKLSQQAYVWMSILNLSKVYMYEFHYDYIDKYGSKPRLLFTITASLMYEIKTEDVYRDFNKDKEIDISNYSAKSKCYGDSNKLVVGKMKNETSSVAIEEFVGLKPKINLFLVNDIKVEIMK